MKAHRVLAMFVGLIWGVSAAVSAQSLTYSRGQNVAPAYEGWEQAADGTKYFVFGYMNRNWEEELSIPPGPNNSFNIGPADQGQPTRFLPRRNRFVFRVKVPANFKEQDELVWTITSHGETEKAYASLRLDYKVDDMVIASETGSLGAGASSPESRSNKAPAVKLETPKSVSVKAGQPLTLVAIVTDDGLPRSRGAGGGGRGGAGRGGGTGAAPAAAAATAAAVAPAAASAPVAAAAPGASAPAGAARGLSFQPPSRVTVGKTNGLHLSWFVYRGAGEVSFDPSQVKPWEDTRAGANSPWGPGWTPPTMPPDGRITTTAVFREPGTYTLRALADDGALTGGADLIVTVTP